MGKEKQEDNVACVVQQNNMIPNRIMNPSTEIYIRIKKIKKEKSKSL